MTLSVRERADTLGTLRFVSVFAMETLARWVPTTPDLEAKVIFGRHIWDFAQHADGLGRRTHELRAALHYTVPPLADYKAALEALRATASTGERLGAFYAAFLPDLQGRYRRYLKDTDALLDEPSVRVVERNLGDLARLMADAAELGQSRPDIVPGGPETEALRHLLRQADHYVQHRPPLPAESGAPA